MSVLERIPELVCPSCKGDLEESDVLRCNVCAKSYEIKDGIPRMLGKDMAESAGEIAVQDRVALEYEQKRYQDPYGKMYHDWWTNQMLTRVRTEGRILDNGCGVGHLYGKLPAKRIVGIDLSSEMLRHAARRSDQIVLGNSEELPFRDRSFDLVFCRGLLHHLPHPGAAVTETHRVLRPGGEIVLADTNASILSTLPRKIATRGEHFSEQHQNLNRRTLERLLEPFFGMDEVMYFGYIAYPFLGFPDLVGVFRFMPFKSIAAPALMALDKVLSRVPLIRAQSWGILVKGTRRQG